MAKKQTSISEITIFLDGKQAEKALDVLNKRIVDLNTEKAKIGSDGLFSNDDLARIKEIDKEIRLTTGSINAVKKQMMDVGDVVRNVADFSEKDLVHALRILTTQTKKLDRSTQEYANNKKNIATLRAELDRINDSGKKTASVFDNIGAIMKRIASYALVYIGFNELTQGLRHLIEVNARFSDQMADIEKTTGIYGKSLAELGKEIRQIDTRTPIEELNNLAYTAGKLGISGKQNIIEFVNAANQINVALGTELGEDAIGNIAKLNDVLGITKQLGVERSLLATGSAINELGQSSTANEGYMVDYAQRLGGIAAQAGISIQQILALASASDQMGQNVEVSATALNKVITTLISKTDQVAKAIGVTSEEMRAALNKSTWEGLMLVFEKLAGKGGLGAIAPLMGDLGSDGARLNAVISSLASNTQKMNDALAISNKAFAEATSLTAETMKKEESLMGIWDRAMKKIQDYFMDSAISNQLKDIAVYVYRVTSDFDELGNRIGGAVNILATFTQWIIKLGVFLVKHIDLIAALSAGYIALKVATVGLQLATKAWVAVSTSASAVLSLWTKRAEYARAATLLYAAAKATLTGNVTRARAAMLLFNKTMLTNPFVLAAAALVSVGTAIYAVYRRSTEATRQMAAFRKEINQNIAAEQAEATYLFESAKKTAEGTDERRRAIEEINQKYKDYLPNLLTETSSTTDLSEALKKVNTALKDQIVMRMKQAETEDVIRTSLTSQLNAIDNIRSASTNTDTMDQKMIDRANELIKTYSDMGATATETFLTVQKALMDEFGQSAKQSGEYWAQMNQYVIENMSERDKLAALDKKYASFSPKPQQEGTQLKEVVVTAPLIPKATISEKDAKKALDAKQKEVDIWLQQQKNALEEAYIDKKAYNGKILKEENAYNQEMNRLEMEALQKRLSILGIEPAEVETIRGQILDIRRKMMDEAVRIQKDIDKILLEADPVKKEKTDFEERLKTLGLYGVERQLMTADQLRALELLEEQHQNNLTDIDRRARTQDKKRAEERFLQEYDKKYGVGYETGMQQNDQYVSNQESDMEMGSAIGNLSADEEFTRQMALFEWKMNALREELALRQEVGAETSDVFEKMAKVEKQSISATIAYTTKKFDSFRQVGETLGESFGTVFENVGEGFKNLGSTMADMALDYLAQMAQTWLTELAISATINTAAGAAKEIGSKGLLGIATAAAIGAAIAGLVAVAKAGVKSLLGGGSKKKSSAAPTTGQRVVKQSGYAEGGYVAGVGGYTGPGSKYEVSGLVHKGEYVVPKWMMQSPVVMDNVRILETIRQTNKPHIPSLSGGYVEGGPVNSSVAIAPATDPELKNAIKQMNLFLQQLGNKEFTTTLNVSRLNDFQNRLSASVARGSRPK